MRSKGSPLDSPGLFRFVSGRNRHWCCLISIQYSQNLKNTWMTFFYCRMKKLKGTDHPTLWDLIKSLRQEDMVARLDIVNTALGNPPRKITKRIYRELSRRLKELIRQYDQQEINMEAFLQGVGYNIRWKAPAHHVANWSVCSRSKRRINTNFLSHFIITRFTNLLLSIFVHCCSATREKFCNL